MKSSCANNAPAHLCIMLCVAWSQSAFPSSGSETYRQQPFSIPRVLSGVESEQNTSKSNLDLLVIEPGFEANINLTENKKRATNRETFSRNRFLIAQNTENANALTTSSSLDTEPDNSHVNTASEVVPSTLDNSAQRIKVTSRWLKQKPAYVQSQLTLLIHIQHDGSLQRGKLKPLQVSNARTHSLGEDIVSQHKIGNKTEFLIEKRIAIIPQKSGEINLAPIHYQAQIVRNDKSKLSDQYIKLESLALKRTILPPPSTFKGATWLPAKSLSLSLYPIKEADYAVGDPINLKIQLEATGLLAEQLPKLVFPTLPNEISVYPSDPILSNRSTHNDIIGKLNRTFVLIPSREGDINLPEIEIAWWNTETDQQVTAYLRLPNITIKAAVGDKARKNDADSTSESTPHSQSQNEATSIITANEDQTQAITAPYKFNAIWYSVMLGVLIAGAAIGALIWRLKIARPSSISKAQLTQSIANIRQLCLAQDAYGTYSALQSWSHNFSSHKQLPDFVTTLRKQGDCQAAQAIDDLKAYLYGTEQSKWSGEKCWRHIEPALRKVNLKQDETTVGPCTIRPLYPS